MNQDRQKQSSTFGEIAKQVPGIGDARTGIFTESFGKFERENATYTWDIWTKKEPIRGMDKSLRGHSKPLNQDEPGDKTYLFKKIISRLNAKGYFRRCARVDFYRNFSSLDSDSVLFLTMYRTTYQLHCWEDQLWLQQFLNSFYTNPLATYGSPTNPFPTQQPIVTNPDGLANLAFPKKERDINTLAKNFKPKSMQHLTQYMETLKSEGYPAEQIRLFYREVSSKRDFENIL